MVSNLDTDNTKLKVGRALVSSTRIGILYVKSISCGHLFLYFRACEIYLFNEQEKFSANFCFCLSVFKFLENNFSQLMLETTESPEFSLAFFQFLLVILSAGRVAFNGNLGKSDAVDGSV